AFLDGSMDAFVKYDRVVAPRKRGEQREIRNEAAAEIKRLLGPKKNGGKLFQLRVPAMMASEQARAARSGDAIFVQRIRDRFAQGRMPRQAEIIIRREVDSRGQRQRTQAVQTLQPLQLGAGALPSLRFAHCGTGPGPNSTLCVVRTGCGKSASSSRISSGIFVLTLSPSERASSALMG